MIRWSLRDLADMQKVPEIELVVLKPKYQLVALAPLALRWVDQLAVSEYPERR